MICRTCSQAASLYQTVLWYLWYKWQGGWFWICNDCHYRQSVIDWDGFAGG